jgi:DNA-binding winged helix-turn-helix (wHTH) protein/tetratricopeptide (TPR) repeat protein
VLPYLPPYRFGPFVLNPAEHRLARDGEGVPLSKRPMAVLVALVERAGHLVTKEELLAAAWEGCVVEENALSVAVSRLRRALGTSGDCAAYIETVPGLGYRFVAPVTREAEPPEPVPPPAPAVSARPERRALLAEAPRQRAERAGSLRLSLTGGVLLVLTAGAVLWIPPALIGWPPFRTATVLETPPDQARPALDLSPEGVARRRAAAEAYRRGRERLATRQPGPEALQAFYLARAIDSTYAPAYLGIAESYAMGHRTHIEALVMAEHALRLDPDLGEAYAVLGFVHAFQRWDWAAAEAAFAEAHTRAPRHVRTQQWYAAYLLVQRRYAEAEAALHRALDLDPRSANLFADLCEVQVALRHYEAAGASCDRALALDPTFPFVKDHLFFLRLLEGRPDEAIRRYPQLPPLPEGRVLPGATPEEHLRAMARYAETLDPPPLYLLARLYAALGDGEASLRALRRLLDQRGFHLPFAHADPVFDGIRETDRFREIMREVGLSE